MTEQLTAKVIELGNDRYLLEKGSYTPKRSSITSVNARKRSIAEGVIKPGDNIDIDSGLVLKDITITGKGALGRLLLSSKEYLRQKTTYTEYLGATIHITYYNSKYEPLDYADYTERNKAARNKGTIKKEPIKKATGNIPTKTGTIIDHIEETKEPTNIEKAQLYFFWVSKLGGTYADVRTAINEGVVDYNGCSNARTRLIAKGLMETFSENTNKLALVITDKGEQLYQELVKKYIINEQQNRYLTVGKEPYTEELKTESIYSLYQRIIHHNSLKKEEVLAPLPEQNVERILGVATYYQLKIDGTSFRDDLIKIKDETSNKSVFDFLRMNIEVPIRICKEMVQQGEGTNDNKKNVIVLTQMLGIIEELIV